MFCTNLGFTHSNIYLFVKRMNAQTTLNTLPKTAPLWVISSARVWEELEDLLRMNF